MRPIKIQLGNYRCFADSEPLRLELQAGFAAMVGPNNSGKSTALRFFYEMRPLFSQCSDVRSLQAFASGTVLGAGTRGTEDPIEIFHFGNHRPLSLQFDLETAGQGELSRVTMSSSREEPSNWNIALFVGPDHRRCTGAASIDNQQGFTVEGGGSYVADLAQWLEFIDVINRMVYIGPFRNAISEGSGTYYDLEIGTSLHRALGRMEDGGGASSQRCGAAGHARYRANVRVQWFRDKLGKQSQDFADYRRRTAIPTKGARRRPNAIRCGDGKHRGEASFIPPNGRA